MAGNENNPFVRLRRANFKPIEEPVVEEVKETEEETEEEINFDLDLNSDVTSKENSDSEDPDYGMDSPEENADNDQELQESELDPDNDPAIIAVQNEPEDEKPAEEPPKKKRHRRTKKEMEAARAAEAAEKAAKLAAKGEEPPESDLPVEEVKQEEAVEETKEVESTEAENTEDVSEPVEEVKKVKRTRTKKDKSEYQDPTDCEEFYRCSLDVESVSADFLSNLEPDDFKKFKEEFTEKVNNIKITEDMNNGAIKYALKDINDLRSILYVPMVKVRQLVNSLTNKEYGVMTAFAAEHSFGDNATDRKANAYKSMRNFTIDGRKIDMIECLTSLQVQSEYFEAINKLLDRKQDMLLSYIALLKIEAKFDTGA